MKRCFASAINQGNMTGKYLIEAGGENPGIVVPMGQYMTQWCLFYSQEPQFLQRVIAEIQLPAQKLQQLVAEMPTAFSYMWMKTSPPRW